MITLYTSYYKDKSPVRQAELDYCLQKNIDNPLIDQIVLMCGDELPPHLHRPNRVYLTANNRPTYQDFFNIINNSLTSNLDISMVANSDIYFDETLSELPGQMAGNKCIALSRWDIKPEGAVLHNEKFSQDVWIFQGKVKPVKYATFNLGVPGCDNRIAWELWRAGYILKNPASRIKAYHYHPSDLHTYHDENGENIKYLYVPKPYLFVELT